MATFNQLKQNLHYSHKAVVARAISLVENEIEGYREFLKELTIPVVPVVGITGPPGAGKSTLISALINQLTAEGNNIAVVAIDPTSPFTRGSLLGDRIRMAEHFNNSQVFIRSLATRGALGGLSAKAVEVVDVLKASGFDMVIIETVGVGQSEIDVVGIADTVAVVLVPESGDEVQVIKSGLMEIADVFVVNKADRPGAAGFVSDLKKMIAGTARHNAWQVPVLSTIAVKKEGIMEVLSAVKQHFSKGISIERKSFLLAEKAYRLIQHGRMKGVNKQQLQKELSQHLEEEEFNLYSFIEKHFPGQ